MPYVIPKQFALEKGESDDHPWFSSVINSTVIISSQPGFLMTRCACFCLVAPVKCFTREKTYLFIPFDVDFSVVNHDVRRRFNGKSLLLTFLFNNEQILSNNLRIWKSRLQPGNLWIHLIAINYNLPHSMSYITEPRKREIHFKYVATYNFLKA